MKLSEQVCEACRAGTPKLQEADMKPLLREIPDWALVECGGMLQLERIYRFPDFAAALAFTNRVGALAEEAGHHPAILTEWGRVTVTWWTHSIKGLHKTDFIMAARCDEVAAG